MELEDDGNITGGVVPEFGAIFMSNRSTKKECFKRKLFGLPSAMADFVKQVKAGMILFLFEFEKRELYGVFQATSDGAINIMPNAYSSSRKQFPAQVKFATIWHCSPLSEFEFKDAIIDNYYSANKFNFGLSENQVHMLLQLFSLRRLNSKIPLRQIVQETREIGKGKKRVNKLIEYTEDELEADSRLGREICVDQPGVYRTKKRKMTKEGRLLMGEDTGSELYEDLGPSHDASADCHLDSFSKIRSPDDMWLSADDRVTEYQISNNNIGSGICHEYPRSPFNKVRRVTEADKFMNEMVEKKGYVDNDYGPFISTAHHEKPLGKGGILLNDNRSSDTRNFVGDERMVENCLRPVLSTDSHQNSQAKRHMDDRLVMNIRLRNKSYVNDDTGSISSTEHTVNSLHRVAREYDVRKSLTSGRAETDFSISSQHFGYNVDNLRSETDRFRSEYNRDDGIMPNMSGEYFRNTLCRDSLLANDGRFTKSDRLENERDTHIGPAFTSEQNHFMDTAESNPSEPNLFTCSVKPRLESDSYLLRDQLQHSSAFLHPNRPKNCTTSYLTSHDATVSKPVPYDPEFPDVRYQCSSGSVASHFFDSVQGHSSQQGLDENFIPLSNNEYSTHLLSRCLDGDSGDGNKYPLHNGDEHHNNSSYRSSNTLMNSGYRSITSGSKGSDEFMYSDSVLASQSFPNGRSTEKANKTPLPSVFSSGNDASLDYDKVYPKEPHGEYEIKPLQRDSNSAFTEKEFRPSDVELSYSSRLCNGSSPQVENSGSHRSELYSDTKNERTSVFARLSVAPKVCLRVDDADTDVVRNDFDLDASVDEVMDLLHQAHNHWVKAERSRPSSEDGNIGYREKSKFKKQKEFQQQLVTKKEMDTDAGFSVNANDTVLKETRVVDFKRRSRIKNNLDEKNSIGSDINSESTSVGNLRPTRLCKTSADAADVGLLGKAGRRRKLIRPDFGTKECPDESKKGDRAPCARSPSEESSYKKTTESCKDALQSLETTNAVPCNAGVAHTMLSATSDKISTLEPSPVSQISGKPETCEALINQDSEGRKEPLQVIKKGDTVSEIPPSERNANIRVGLEIEDKVKVSIQDLLSMIGSGSSTSVSRPVLTEVTADPGI